VFKIFQEVLSSSIVQSSFPSFKNFANLFEFHYGGFGLLSQSYFFLFNLVEPHPFLI